jgi:hypothetical protein
LDLAEAAYEKENYSDAISLLAQSIEISSKSFLSHFDIISPNEFTTVGHIPTKGFEKSIDKVDTGYDLVNKNLSQIKWEKNEIIPEFDIKTIQSDKRQMKTMMSFISNNPARFKSMSKKNMEDLLTKIQNLQIQLEISRNKIFTEQGYLKNIDDFQKEVFHILEVQKMKKEQIQMFKYVSIVFYKLLDDSLDIKDKAVIFHNIVNVTVTTTLLSIITQPHAVASRYSSKGYSKNILLVNRFPLMKMELKNALADLETIFFISEKSANF